MRASPRRAGRTHPRARVSCGPACARRYTTRRARRPIRAWRASRTSTAPPTRPRRRRPTRETFETKKLFLPAGTSTARRLPPRGGTAWSTGSRRAGVPRFARADSTDPPRRARKRGTCRRRICHHAGAPRTGASRARRARGGTRLERWGTPRARTRRRSAGARSGASSGAASPGGGASRGAWRTAPPARMRSCRSTRPDSRATAGRARPPSPRSSAPPRPSRRHSAGGRRIPGRSPRASRSQPSAQRGLRPIPRIVTEKETKGPRLASFCRCLVPKFSSDESARVRERSSPR